jgi:hypothetical protein
MPTLADPGLRALLEQILERLPRAKYAETDILDMDELAAAAKVSRAKLFEKLPELPVSYSLGDRSPRIIYGDFLKYLRGGIQ